MSAVVRRPESPRLERPEPGRTAPRTVAERRSAVRYGEPAARDVAGDWRALLDRDDVLILDTETTGLGKGAEVIEVAVLDTTGAVQYESLSLPVGRIQPGARDVRGLTRERLREAGARPWPAVHGELVAILDRAAMVLAWYADFDRRLLRQTAERHGLSLPRVSWRDMLPEYRAHRGERPGKGRHESGHHCSSIAQ